MSDEGLEEFCEREHPRLVGLLRLYCGDEHAAHELAQEALIRAVASWPQVGRLDSPGGWTYRVAINLANSRFRRRAAGRRAQRRLEADAALVEQPVDVPMSLAVRAAVAELPARQREALVLQHYLGLEPAEIGELMGCSAQAVRNLTHRARVRLQPALTAIQEADDVPQP